MVKNPAKNSGQKKWSKIRSKILVKKNGQNPNSIANETFDSPIAVEMSDPSSDTGSFESFSSEEAMEAYRFVRQGELSRREMLPPGGLIPLTGLGKQRYGAIDVAQTYRSRPIKVHRPPRPPCDGDVFAWGSNYDGQVPSGA